MARSDIILLQTERGENMRKDYPACVFCGSELIGMYAEMFEPDGEEVTFTVRGKCSMCDKKHEWKEEFVYSNFFNVTAVR